MFSNPINFNGSRAFFFHPIEMNPLISKTRAVGQSLMSVAILPLIARSAEFDLVYSDHLYISLRRSFCGFAYMKKLVR